MEENIFNIRYVKLHFTLRFLETCNVPKYKASALRGGIGEMLLQSNCISDRNCEKCEFESECIVRRTMYSKLDRKPDFVSAGDSVGYVIECEDYHEHFHQGDTLEMRLILFGKTIVYFSQYLNALYALGQSGLGRENAVFSIEQVRGTRGECIMDGTNVYMQNYRVNKVSEYICYRRESLLSQHQIPDKIVLKTPTAIKYRGKMLEELTMDAIIKNIQRRIYILDCFEGIDGEAAYQRKPECPEICGQQLKKRSMERYSSRHDERMRFYGMEGVIWLETPLQGEALDYFLAAELIHLGSNTSFGFGRIQVKEEK